MVLSCNLTLFQLSLSDYNEVSRLFRQMDFPLPQWHLMILAKRLYFVKDIGLAFNSIGLWYGFSQGLGLGIVLSPVLKFGIRLGIMTIRKCVVQVHAVQKESLEIRKTY